MDWKIASKFQTDLQPLASTNVSEKYVELFNEATELISPFVESKKISAFFVRDELKILLTAKERIAEWLPNVIIYNLSKIDKIQDDRNIMVIFLEELVHAYYNTFDEDFVGKKVAEIYDDISFNSITHKYEFSLKD